VSYNNREEVCYHYGNEVQENSTDDVDVKEIKVMYVGDTPSNVNVYHEDGRTKRIPWQNVIYTVERRSNSEGDDK